MTKLHWWAVVCCIAALVGFACYGIVHVARLADSWAAMPDRVSDIQSTAEQLPDQVLPPVLGTVEALGTQVITKLDKQFTALRQDLVPQVVTLREDASGTVKGLRSDLQPVLQHAGSVAAQVDDAAPLYLDCDHNPDCAFNRFQGTSKAIEKAAMNVGQMSQDFRGALPKTLVTLDEIGQHANKAADESAKTAEQSRVFMQNLVRISKPLPSYIRIPLSVAGAVAPVASGAVGAAAAAGAFR